MRCLLFEEDPPKFYREFENMPMNQIPVNMIAYYPNQKRKWVYRIFSSGRAGQKPFETMDEEFIPKPILVMALLLT